jgi:hypothetical protein
MQRTLRPLAAVCLVLAVGLLPAPADAQRRVEVYKAKYRVAAELQPIAQAGMGEGGTVTLDGGTNSLVLVGEPGAVAGALALLASQDRRLRTVVLRYDTKRVRELAELGFDVRWSARSGDFRIGNVGRPPGAGGSSVSVRADDALGKLAESFSGSMRVTEGASTRIETGTTVPFSTANAPLGTTQNRRGPSTQFVTVGTGFEASARILGDGRVEVDLAAFSGELAGELAGQLGGRGGAIETLRAGTLVTVKPGETLAVGGLAQSSEAGRQAALQGARSESSRDETVLLLRADVE